MRCPYCGEENTRVIDSRPSEDSSIRRRRVCESCDRRFTTYERIEAFPMMVIKKDNTREVFDRTKIEKGILLACHKRPISTKQIQEMINEIEKEVYDLGEKEVQSTIVGEKIMQKLKVLDEVAYVRFASVYREFKDVKTFARELENLQRALKS